MGEADGLTAVDDPEAAPPADAALRASAATRDELRDILGIVLQGGQLLLENGAETVAALTTTLRAIPTEVIVGPAEGLPRECAVNLDHIYTVPRSQIGELVTALPHERMIEVEAAIRFALGFEALSAAP